MQKEKEPQKALLQNPVIHNDRLLVGNHPPVPVYIPEQELYLEYLYMAYFPQECYIADQKSAWYSRDRTENVQTVGQIQGFHDTGYHSGCSVYHIEQTDYFQSDYYTQNFCHTGICAHSVHYTAVDVHPGFYILDFHYMVLCFQAGSLDG